MHIKMNRLKPSKSALDRDEAVKQKDKQKNEQRDKHAMNRQCIIITTNSYNNGLKYGNDGMGEWNGKDGMGRMEWEGWNGKDCRGRMEWEGRYGKDGIGRMELEGW